MKRVYRAPLFLSVLTIVGLLSALLGDELWDAISWVLLVVPLSVMSFSLYRSKNI
jgi:hypothetical protein